MRLDECANVLSIFKIIFHLRLHMTYSVTVLSIGIGHLCFGSQTQNDCSYVPKTKHKLTGMVNIHLGGVKLLCSLGKWLDRLKYNVCVLSDLQETT